MNPEYRRAIADAVARIAATSVLEGEPPEKLRQVIADRVADLGKPSNAPASTLAPHQQRVVTERDELAERLSKLLAFFSSPFFAGLDAAEQVRLRCQSRFMSGYLDVLNARIEAFSAPQAADLNALVQRFLQWPVPAHIHPDGTPGQPGRTGTNLLDAETAKAMLQHVLGG